ncbi:IS6 family transposase [Mesorhizobium sp. B2-3-6]|nr:IS6 family transposase [Mesorhizobium sp. B2-4-10]TPM18209.1 IS6 family transposase [Mesorhizobium sp. B2-3-6]
MAPPLHSIVSRIHLKQLRLLLALGEHGSLLKASQQVALTQPGEQGIAGNRDDLRSPLGYGRPERIIIDGSQTNREAVISCDAESRLRDRPRRSPKPIHIRNSKYLNNWIEQNHRRVKRRIHSMFGFK